MAPNTASWRSALCRAVLVAAAAGLAACTASPSGPAAAPEPLRAELATADDGGAIVHVFGLSTLEVQELQRDPLANADWSRLLRVTVADGDGTPVAGAYRVRDNGLDFMPAFPFDPGRVYEVTVDPAHLPTPRAEAVETTLLSLPAPPAAVPETVVSAIYPSGDVWPANLLRFYLHFSAPMSRSSGVGRIRLTDADGVEDADALLPLEADFWSADATRYTVFFEPGRVKRGIGPNLEQGRALTPGHRYAIVVDASWPDADGQPLARTFRHEFTAGPPVEEGLSLDEWEVIAPTAGSRDSLVVRFPAPLDHALLQRAIGVALAGEDAFGGEVTVSDAETRWTFTPTEPWRAGAHELIVLSVLEDPAGNRPGQAFEVAQATALPERSVVPFWVP